MDTFKNLARVLFMLFPVTVALVMITSSSNAASPQALQALLNNPTQEYAPGSVLVRFKPSVSPAQKLNSRALVQGDKIRGYGLVKGLEHMKLGKRQSVEKAIKLLQKLPFVEYAEPDYVLHRDTDDSIYYLQWGLNNTGQDIRGVMGTPDADIDAEEAWEITTGDPEFVVAVIDSGVEYTHEDLINKTWINPEEIPNDNIDNDGNGYIDDIYGWDFFSNDNDPMDEEGHGTHVAGTICAEGNNGLGVSGVAWQCRIMALRHLGPDGGYTSDAIAALNYAVDNGVRISNNSWGGAVYSQSLYDAIQNAGTQGHLYVAAAGNGGFDEIGDDTDAMPYYPSSYDLENIISVAATDNLDQLAGFSNYGSVSVDVGAPGVEIASTMLSAYYWRSGTSMAAPHVTGVAALIFDLHPDWTHQQVRDRIFNTVRPIAALNGITVTGGVVNAYGALLAPEAPSNLTATAISDTQIELAWTDNSSNEDEFRIERSLDSVNWVEIVAVGQDTSVYIDSSLSPETTYYYQIRAVNSAGYSSIYSNAVSATTDPTPILQEVVAIGSIYGPGNVTGTFEDTWYDDDVAQSIIERSSGGRPSSRYSYFRHTWMFEVPPGSATFYLNAWSSQSTDGDSFLFSYSLDNINFTEMLSLNGGDDVTGLYSFILPPGSTGTVYVRLTDSDRTAGNKVMDNVTIDQMYILVGQQAGESPAAPTNLTADTSIEGQIDLVWTDSSVNEYVFEIERSGDGTIWSVLTTIAAGSQTYTDTDVASEATYYYRVRAFNGVGYSSYSNEISATTLTSSGIAFSVTGYKVKGSQYVDLEWSNSSIFVDVYRDSRKIQDGVSGGSYTDGPLIKGGSISYSYQICESGGTINCSNEAIANF